MADLYRELSPRGSLQAEADELSTIALNFSAALDDIFNLDSASELARTVELK